VYTLKTVWWHKAAQSPSTSLRKVNSSKWKAPDGFKDAMQLLHCNNGTLKRTEDMKFQIDNSKLAHMFTINCQPSFVYALFWLLFFINKTSVVELSEIFKFRQFSFQLYWVRSWLMALGIPPGMNMRSSWTVIMSNNKDTSPNASISAYKTSSHQR